VPSRLTLSELVDARQELLALSSLSRVLGKEPNSSQLCYPDGVQAQLLFHRGFLQVGAELAHERCMMLRAPLEA
jgi:hypothetical protein